jgi:hypothetical protein
LEGQCNRVPPPIDLAEKAYAAADAGEWPRFAKFVHPLALAGFRGQQLGILKAARDAGNDRFVDFYLRRVLRAFTLKEAEELPPDTLLIRYLEYNREVRLERAEMIRPPPARHFVGDVIEGDSIAYVVTRLSDSEGGSSAQGGIRFLTLRCNQREWLTMLDGGLVFGPDGEFSFSFTSADGRELYADSSGMR